MGSPIMLCRLDALAPGSARGFDPSGAGWDSVIAVRLLNVRDDGTPVRLYRNDCPHEHRPLGWRKDAFLAADGRHLMCFAHGARFEIDTGICVDGPCAGAALEALACRIEDGTVRLANEH